MKNDKTIYLIPYAHLDTQWRWEYPTTIKKYIKNTIDENLLLLEKYPTYCFNFTGTIRYQMMKEYYPEGFEKVKKYIQEGRWHLAGTCLDETDAIVPSVESMVRNILYGDKWQKAEFGKSSNDYMLPDCFGFPSNMPTVLKHCGIQGFSTQKLTWGSAVGIPFNVGRWQGPDKSELLCAFDPGEYVDFLKTPVQNRPDRVEKLEKLGKKTGVWKTLQYYGVGDIGGAPQESSVLNALESEKLSSSSEIKVKQTSCGEFFDSFTEEEKAKLEKYQGDLLLTFHSAGSITSQAIMKRFNRQNEQLAFIAEYYALIAQKVAGLKYPATRIERAWRKVVGNQMHDILPGTCTPTAYEHSYNDEILALTDWSKIIEDSICAIAPYINGTGNVLVVNPFEYKRTALCEAVFDNLDINKTYCLVDSDGNQYSTQISSFSDGKYLLVGKVELGAFEIKKFEVKESALTSEALSLKNENGGYVLENEFIKLSISNEGEIFSLFDKKTNSETFKKPLSYHFQNEFPSEYPAWNMDWNDRKLSPCAIISKGIVKVIEDGLIRKTLQIAYAYKKSVLIKEVSLAAGMSCVDFVERIDWRGQGVSLKLAVSTDYAKPACTFNWESSVIERPINFDKQYEVPSRYFADIHTDKVGVAIIENCKYGYDRPDENTLRLTLLYTPRVKITKGFYDQKYQDFGAHTIKYALYPHGADSDVDLYAKAFNRPLRSYLMTGENLAPADLNLFEVNGKEIGIFAVKKAEYQDGYVLRMYGRKKIDNKAVLKFSNNVEKVFEINGIEQTIRELPLELNKLETEIKANAIVSLLIQTKKDLATSVLQKSVAVGGENQYDLLPRDLLGDSINSGGVTFNISPGGTYAAPCKGQKISIEKNYNTISFLISADTRSTAEIAIFDKSGAELAREAFTAFPSLGFVGQFDKGKYLFPITHAKLYKRDYAWINKFCGVKKGFVRPSKVVWYTTHTHKNNSDLYYNHGYLEQIDIKLPDNAAYLLLPQNAAIKVLATTLSNQKATLTNITKKSDIYEF